MDWIVAVLLTFFGSGAITCLQFDEVHLVSGSVDKSIKVSKDDCCVKRNGP